MKNYAPEHKFSHLYWIGGSPCGGKSSVAQLLATHCDLALYRIDDQIDRLLQTITPHKQPALTHWEQQSWEERWMQPVEDLLTFVNQAYGEEFALCIKEIRKIPPDQPTVIEGNPLQPQLIQPFLPDRSHAIWLIAEDEDLRFYYQQREWARQILKACSDPAEAFRRWMERDILFAHQVRQACETQQFPYLMSDRSQTLREKARLVADHFQLRCEL